MSYRTPANLAAAADDVPEDLRTWVDAYFVDELDAERLVALEARLTADVAARRFFVRYAQLDHDLRLEANARRQADAALAKLGMPIGADRRAVAAGEGVAGGAGLAGDPPRPVAFGRSLRPRPGRWLAAAAAVAVAASAGWWVARTQDRRDAPRTIARGGVEERTEPNPAAGGNSSLPGVGLRAGATQPAVGPGAAAPARDVAWLVNAQNCRWANGAAPADMRPGTRLDVERGLAELRFRSGAAVLLEGPAKLDLLSDNSAKLLRGKLTGRVDGPIKGFELLSPRGRVIDLGTEFGVSVADGGETDVYVFEGKVQAVGGGDARVLDLTRAQAARIDAGGSAVRRDAAAGEAQAFVRDIVPPPVIEPRTTALNFGKAYDGTVADARGLGTGLGHRLPGTGHELTECDPNLTVNAEQGRLELTTTDSDINGQRGLSAGEYLGVRLADLGFTGPEDFEVQVFLPNVPALQNVGQFGLYAGARSDKVIRGGLLSRGNRSPATRPADGGGGGEGSYTVFMTSNDGGRDRDSHFLGLFSMGDDIRVRLKRTAGKYALTVENVTTGAASTLSIRHPAYLDLENDLYVGLFGANTGSPVRRTLYVKEFAVTVWTKAGGRSMAGRAGDEDQAARAKAW